MNENKKTVLKFKFIEGNEEYGIQYDWNAIRKVFRGLKTPANLWDPTEVPWESIAYDVELSTRATGKTTQAILFGMCARKVYPGFQIGIMRCREEQIMPKNVSKMLDTIRSYDGGRYIRYLTDGRWNDIQHDRQTRSFRYVNRDERGDIFEKEEEPFLLLLDLPEADDYKSSFSAPRLDMLIFDEFIAEMYEPESFSRLMTWISTIFRKRLSGKLCMMANTIRPASPWYRELEISKELRKLKLGDPGKLYTTALGTPIWMHVFDTPSEHRRKIASWFFGFKNPALAAIRGDGELWVYRKFQRIQYNRDTDQKISQALKIDTGDEYLGVDIVYTEDRGLVANIHPITKIRPEDLVLTNGEIWDLQHRKGRGYGPLCELLETLEARGKLYFSDAETVTSYDAFMAEADAA